MASKQTLKDEVESAILALHQKIDSLKAKVDKLCQSTSECTEKVATKKKGRVVKK